MSDWQVRPWLLSLAGFQPGVFKLTNQIIKLMLMLMLCFAASNIISSDSHQPPLIIHIHPHFGSYFCGDRRF